MKVISFSLWGDDKKYLTGAIKNAQIASTIYPEWICRYYIGKDVPIETINILNSFDNTDTVQMSENGGWKNGTLWRFQEISKDEVTIMISRDCDSRLNYREKEAVNKWILSDKKFHIMRDHPHHNVPILAGMFGCKKGIIKNINQLINNYNHITHKQNDQNFLKKIIYPIVKDDSMVHDPFFAKNDFPTKRIDNEFVGEVYDENDNPNENDRKALNKHL